MFMLGLMVQQPLTPTPMTTIVSPPWLDREAYPFEPRSFKVPAGNMHYIDEGGGDQEVPRRS
jgi:hypothetical protein